MSLRRPTRGRTRTLVVSSAAVGALLLAPFAPVSSSSAAAPGSAVTGATKAATPAVPVDTLGKKLLTVAFDAPQESLEVGRPFTVTGTVAKVTQAALGRRGAGTASSFTLAVTDVQGNVLGTQDVTTADDGTFTTTVPASLTAGLAGVVGANDVDGVDGAEDQTLALRALDAEAAGGYRAEDAGATGVTLRAAATGLRIKNSFVSSVGWVKPGQTYPSRVIITNPTSRTIAGATVSIKAPRGTTFRKATGSGRHTLKARTISWRLPAIRKGRTVTLVVTSRASSTKQLPTVVWRDLSTRAGLHQKGRRGIVASAHGPKVIPPSAVYDSARYGDRPFPIIPVQYSDRAYVPGHDGLDLANKINNRKVKGSTFNLYQEMSIKQLFPQGDVPSAGIATADFDYKPGFDFIGLDPTSLSTCTGLTVADVPGAVGSPLYSERITDGVYNLPGMTQWYGADANGSAVVGSLTGVAALQMIDSGCGPTGKLVADAAALSDPDIDFSDFDTDKDGIVDFFMVVYAGCGGNGASQLGACSSATSDLAPYDNIWPHSSSLEGSIVDPVSGLTGYTTDDQLKDLTGKPLFYTSAKRNKMTTKKTAYKVFVRIGPYNVNPETAIDKASVISHEYGHSLGLPDFYSGAGRETYGDWNLMATDKSQNMDAYSRQELGWVVPEVLTRSKTVKNIPDSKQDIGTITWKTPSGKSYTLKNRKDGTVHNSKMYVARLKGRELLSSSVFDTGAKATKSHVWYSGSGNDFGCSTDDKGHNLDISLPALSKVKAGTPVTVEFKSNWDIEWDFDYGYVLTSGTGETFTSHASENGYTTSNSDILAGNPNQSGCQAALDNGITGTSGSYAAGSQVLDRKTGTTPAPVFVKDAYDISDLAGTRSPTLRFSYSSDPGLARPGWFIDDVVVKAGSKVIYRSDFEKSGGPSDPSIFNGGCQADNPGGKCTDGWQYVKAGAEADFDHAYYLEMRDRSGFDLAGNGEIDRDPIGWQPGLYLAYTDEAHGYGNTGSDGAPAQSPLDAKPTPGDTAPNLNDASFTSAKGRTTFTDTFNVKKKQYGHTDNYEDPSNSKVDPRFSDIANPWRFTYNCLTFRVLKMKGQSNGPSRANGDLTGTVRFTLGKGCGTFNYGYPAKAVTTRNTAPAARFSVSDTTPEVGQTVTFDGSASTDRQTPRNLDYTWSFDDGGKAKDATGVRVTHKFTEAGTYDVLLRVGDPQGKVGYKRVRVTVRS